MLPKFPLVVELSSSSKIDQLASAQESRTRSLCRLEVIGCQVQKRDCKEIDFFQPGEGAILVTEKGHEGVFLDRVWPDMSRQLGVGFREPDKHRVRSA